MEPCISLSAVAESQSGLYRVTYAGDESTALVKNEPSLTKETKIRRELEAYRG